MEPIGPLTFDEAKAAFAEQALALKAGGADVLWIETMSSREEVEAAVAGAAVAELPIVCTLSFDTNGRTMMGISPSDFSSIEQSLTPRLAACGTNCGVGASEVVACIHNLAEAMGPDVVLVAKGNCGIPQYVDGAICYNGTPEIMALYARMALDAGARIIGEAREKTGVLSFVLDGVHPHDAGTILDQQGVAVRPGQHCAQPGMDRYCIPATIRASLGIYNTREDIDALVAGLHKVREVFS